MFYDLITIACCGRTSVNGSVLRRTEKAQLMQKSEEELRLPPACFTQVQLLTPGLSQNHDDVRRHSGTPLNYGSNNANQEIC